MTSEREALDWLRRFVPAAVAILHDTNRHTDHEDNRPREGQPRNWITHCNHTTCREWREEIAPALAAGVRLGSGSESLDAARALRLAATMLERAGVLPIAVHPVEEAMRRAERAAELAGVRLGSGSESLDAAWAKAEAAISRNRPGIEYGYVSEVSRTERDESQRWAAHGMTRLGGWIAFGPTPAAALLALADRLTGATEPTP